FAVHVNAERSSNCIAGCVSWLFNVRRHFLLLLFLGVAAVCVLLWFSASPLPSTTAGAFGFDLALAIVALLVFHELGHAAACRALGIRIDGFGAGVYLIFPALFTKLSLISELDQRGRIIAYSG